MQVLLFANGDINHGTMVQRCLARAAASRIICADGGALHARALGLRPHTIIGDMDSLAPQQVQAFAADDAIIRRHPPEKDETDLELALLHCADIGAVSVTILGGLGGRFDQTLANILLLTHPAFSALDIAVVDGEQTIRLLRPGAHESFRRNWRYDFALAAVGARRGHHDREPEIRARRRYAPFGAGARHQQRDAGAAGDGRVQPWFAAAHAYSRARLMRAFTVVKRDAAGKFELSYDGVLVERNESFVCIDAVFALEDRDLGYVKLRRGDRFREWFFADQWFNIFRVQDGDTGALKGWYCNITRPPVITAASVTADDLVLDVFVFPDGRTLLLDEGEFARLGI